MGWKKALFFGGAVLVLAACSDSATAPTALRKADAPEASLLLMPATTTTTTTTSPLPRIGPICTGIVIRTGIDGQIVADSTTTSCETSW
jgi:hypothetical protein